MGKMGGFIGKIRTPEAQDCLYDAMDMEILHESVSKKLGKRSAHIKAKCQDREQESHREKMQEMDKAHKDDYLRIMEWIDAKMGTIVEMGKSRDMNELNKQLEVLNRLVDVDIIKQKKHINSAMKKSSTQLLEKRYDKARTCRERETNLVKALEDLDTKCAEVKKTINRRRRGSIQ